MIFLNLIDLILFSSSIGKNTSSVALFLVPHISVFSKKYSVNLGYAIKPQIIKSLNISYV